MQIPIHTEQGSESKCHEHSADRKSVNELKKSYLQMINVNSVNGAGLKKPPLVPQAMIQHQPSVSQALHRMPINPKKSLSIESIPSSMPNNNNNKKQHQSSALSHLITSNGTKNDNVSGKTSVTQTSSSNNDNFPLTNIVNRQRTINRSFRTAVDKSFDNPSASGKIKFKTNCFFVNLVFLILINRRFWRRLC